METFRRASMWIFGREGWILAHPETQALIVTSSVLVSGTMLISPLIADLAAVLAVSEVRAGWLIVGYTAATALTLPLVGAIADRIRRKVLLVTGLVLFGVAGVAMASIPAFEVVLGLRILQGVGFAFAMPTILTMIGDLYEGSKETTVQGMRVSVNSVMNAGVPLVAGLLFVHSWRYPFVIYLLALPAALWIWVSVPDVETPAEWPFRTYAREMWEFLRNPTMALLMASFVLRFIVFYGIVTYISVLAVREVGLAVVAVGALLGVQNLVKTVSSTQVGRLSHTYSPVELSLGSFVLAAVGTAMMGTVPTAAALVAGILIWGVGDGILAPAQKSLINQLSPAEYRGGTMTTALMCQNVGKVIGPIGLGAVLGVIGPGPAFVLLGVGAGGLGVVTMVGMRACQRS